MGLHYDYNAFLQCDHFGHFASASLGSQFVLAWVLQSSNFRPPSDKLLLAERMVHGTALACQRLSKMFWRSKSVLQIGVNFKPQTVTFNCYCGHNFSVSISPSGRSVFIYTYYSMYLFRWVISLWTRQNASAKQISQIQLIFNEHFFKFCLLIWQIR